MSRCVLPVLSYQQHKWAGCIHRSQNKCVYHPNAWKIIHNKQDKSLFVLTMSLPAALPLSPSSFMLPLPPPVLLPLSLPNLLRSIALQQPVSPPQGTSCFGVDVLPSGGRKTVSLFSF